MDSKFISALSKHTNSTGKNVNQNIKYKSSENKTNNDDFEESIVNKNSDDYKFDCFVEKLQEIVIEDEFENLQNDFCEKYYKIFEDKNENKLEYTEIFNKYTKLIENYLEKNLIKRVPQFNVNDFYKMLESKKFKIDEQLLDILINFADFQNFKQLMLDYKHKKENKNDILFLGLNVQKINNDNFDKLNEQFQTKNKKNK
jgi:ADP-ribosylation factor 2-binding protein